MHKYQECVQFLIDRRAGDIKHSSRSLLVHLERTYQILKAAGKPQYLCLAGLMHSVYGTSVFKKATIPLDNRQILIDLIGQDAERLVWYFCQLDRPSSFISYLEGNHLLKFKNGNDVFSIETENDVALLNDLLSIEGANLLDQQALWRNKWLIPHAIDNCLLTKDGFSIYRVSEVYAKARINEFNLMLDSARQGARLKLMEKINSMRLETATVLIGGDDIRKIKLHQALQFEQHVKSGNPELLPVDQIYLLDNYAKSYQRSVIEAAEIILASCSNNDNILVQTEIIKDNISGELALATSLAEIDRIRKKIDMLTLTP